MGASASVNVFPTSELTHFRLSGAEKSQVRRYTGCSTHAAYVSARVIALLYRGPPLHVPLDFSISRPVSGSSL